jgi:hypothetical protein
MKQVALFARVDESVHTLLMMEWKRVNAARIPGQSKLSVGNVLERCVVSALGDAAQTGQHQMTLPIKEVMRKAVVRRVARKGKGK